MKSSLLQSAWQWNVRQWNVRQWNARQWNVCKVALLAVAIGLLFAPGEASACSRFCPQYLAQYCVVQPDGQIETVWTNPCFACWQHIRILYMGQCKFRPVIIPRTCKGTTCE
jgi:hypothetical protein